jgi:hypothetical protein
MNRLLTCALSGALLLLGSVAHAECDQGTREAAMWDAAEGEARGYTCEVIRLENDTYEAQCDETAHADETAACDAFVDATYSADVGSEDRHMDYEACMTIALHTPGAVRL